MSSKSIFITDPEERFGAQVDQIKRALKVTGDLTISGSTPIEVIQDTHDDLNANVNLQVGDVDVANGNPVPISDAGGSLTVDGTVAVSSLPDVKQSVHDNLNANANIQVGDVDVANGNPVPISDAGGSVTIDDGGGSITVDGAVTIQEPLSIDDGGGSITVDQLSEHSEDAAHSTGNKGLLILAVRNDNAATTLTDTNGDYSGLAVDAQGRLLVRQMDRKIKLTGSTDGKPIAITNFATSGNVIDLTAGLGAEQGYAYFLMASFVTQAQNEKDATLTLEFGGNTVNEQLTFTIPLEDTIDIAIGDSLYANALTIAAFVGTSGQQVNITGWKELIIA